MLKEEIDAIPRNRDLHSLKIVWLYFFTLTNQFPYSYLFPKTLKDLHIVVEDTISFLSIHQQLSWSSLAKLNI